MKGRFLQYLCGMRHPSTVRKDGDLSRLTSSSSSSSSNDSRNGTGSFFLPGDCSELNSSSPHCFQSNYLPEVIDPSHEWQAVSRKRKDRQDSTSSTTQDRKLVRSNSEEHIPNVDYEVIRRVCSHEEFKRPLQDRTNSNNNNNSSSNGCVATTVCPPYDSDKMANNEVQEILKETHKRSELSPARSRAFDFSHKLRISPNRDAGAGNHVGSRNGEDVDGENERRRTSERFCRARVQPGRKQSTKRPSKYLASRLRGGRDENVYKYDVNVSKGERRGFLSSKAPKSETKQTDDENVAPYVVNNDNNVCETQPPPIIKSPKTLVRTVEEPRPWDLTYQDDTPVVCPRFADTTYAQVHHAGERHFDAESANRATSGSSGGNGNWKTLGHFMKVENLKTREIMQNIKAPSSAYATPDERLNQVNKRLISLKRRAASFEAAFEIDHGFRPSLADKQNDRFIKNVLAEIHKLRKEKQQLKSDPMAAMGFRVMGAGAVSRLAKVKETVVEIEKRLQDRRIEERRSAQIEELTTDQLMQEKTAVQKALIYFESQFGRPATREERDAARDLYARYRQLKRMVNRSVSQNFSLVSGLSELPTIMEHEAMQFSAPSPAKPLTTGSISSVAPSIAAPLASGPNSPVSELSTTDSTDTTSSSVHENVHQLSVDELWHHLEIAREQKQELRRTIKDFEQVFEQQNGRRMLKTDRTMIEETYILYKQKKAKLRLLEALVKKQMAK